MNQQIDQSPAVQPSVQEEALQALALLEEHDQVKVMDYIKTLVSYSQSQEQPNDIQRLQR